MVRLLVEKELRDIIASAKFAASFGVCSILILSAFFIGAHNFHVSVAQNEAAKAENLRKMEGLTDWIRVQSHRIFLAPEPLSALVTGVSSDVGRTIEMRGRGELVAHDSRYGDDPIFAVFRFLDLEFIFLVVLSLFAILFGYDAINGEKERGTLRLTFANAVPRDTYILGKLLGSFLALGIPLLIPILLGCLILMVLGVPMSPGDWMGLALIVFAGLLYLGTFLTLSVFVSSLTRRSSSAFLFMLVIWVVSVLIIPRSSVLLACRAVRVPSIDEQAYQKSRLQAQLMREDLDRMGSFKPSETGDHEKIMQEFNQFMEGQAKERDRKMKELFDRLNEERRNRQVLQERWAFGIARISPSAVFSLAASAVAGTGLELKQHFLEEATAYQEVFGRFILEKTGMNPGGRVILIKMTEDGEEEKPIDLKELPPFEQHPRPLQDRADRAMLDFCLLLLGNILFFAGSFVAFRRYDVR